MSRVALKLIYDGSAFHGWQVQKNAVTVQSTIQDAVECVTGRRIDISGCSRTDSGVHANEYFCHMDYDSINIPPEKFMIALNAHLSNKIAVSACNFVDDDFHARYSCIGKEYLYKIWNERYINPLYDGKVLFYPMPVDVEKLRFVENEFCGTHNFKAFMSRGSKITDDTIRSVKYFKANKQDGLLTIRVCADGFLYNMVRIMVGTYLFAAMGKYKEGDISAIINSANRALAGDTMPAHALYLNKVFYNKEEMENYAAKVLNY